MQVRPRPGENINATLRRFRKLLEKEGVIKDMKRRTYYESPSEARSRNKRRIKREIEKQKRQPTPEYVDSM